MVSLKLKEIHKSTLRKSRSGRSVAWNLSRTSVFGHRDKCTH